MDQNWDSTLSEVIPLFVEASSGVEYNKAILKLAKRINDGHGFLLGGVLDSFYGTIYPRFAIGYFEDETVIYKVDNSISEVKPGDIIRYLDDAEIGVLRDSCEVYSCGSNELAVQYNAHQNVINGLSGDFNITVENEQGIFDYTLQRNWSYSQHEAFLPTTGPVWFDTIIDESCNLGYVDMSRLTVSQVGSMMNDLWNTDAIIFDIRNYPMNTLWTLVNYLFTQPILISSYTTPDILYPGVIFWQNDIIGGYNTEVYNGRLIILFDIFTWSQAEYTCMGLEQHPGAIKIGSQTGAADGNVSGINLPGSITGYFSGLGVFYPDYTPTQRVGIIPDIEVFQTIEGIRQGIDEVLEAAFDCSFVGNKNIIYVNNLFSIIPNPSKDKITISSPSITDNTHLSVFNVSGEKVLEKQLTDTETQIDISALPRGVYFVRVRNEKMVEVEKMVKE